MIRRTRDGARRLWGDLHDPGRVSGLTWAKRAAALVILPPACWIAFHVAVGGVRWALAPSAAEREASEAAFFAMANDLAWGIQSELKDAPQDGLVRSGHYTFGESGRMIHLTGPMSDDAYEAGRSAAEAEFTRLVALHADEVHSSEAGATRFVAPTGLLTGYGGGSKGSPPGWSGNFWSPVQSWGYVVRSAQYDRDGMRGVLTLSMFWERRLVVLTLVEQPL